MSQRGSRRGSRRRAALVQGGGEGGIEGRDAVEETQDSTRAGVEEEDADVAPTVASNLTIVLVASYVDLVQKVRGGNNWW